MIQIDRKSLYARVISHHGGEVRRPYPEAANASRRDCPAYMIDIFRIPGAPQKQDNRYRGYGAN
jgi:hypothetical protein